MMGTAFPLRLREGATVGLRPLPPRAGGAAGIEVVRGSMTHTP
jgi:hypothetical protein